MTTQFLTIAGRWKQHVYAHELKQWRYMLWAERRVLVGSDSLGAGAPLGPRVDGVVEVDRG